MATEILDLKLLNIIKISEKLCYKLKIKIKNPNTQAEPNYVCIFYLSNAQCDNIGILGIAYYLTIFQHLLSYYIYLIVLNLMFTHLDGNNTMVYYS